jgi:hypothetical protein
MSNKYFISLSAIFYYNLWFSFHLANKEGKKFLLCNKKSIGHLSHIDLPSTQNAQIFFYLLSIRQILIVIFLALKFP